MKEERKQGIYLNGERVAAACDATTRRMVDDVLRISGGHASMEVWSRGGRLINAPPEVPCWVCDTCKSYRWVGPTPPANCPVCNGPAFAKETNGKARL